MTAYALAVLLSLWAPEPVEFKFTPLLTLEAPPDDRPLCPPDTNSVMIRWNPPPDDPDAAKAGEIALPCLAVDVFPRWPHGHKCRCEQDKPVCVYLDGKLYSGWPKGKCPAEVAPEPVELGGTLADPCQEFRVVQNIMEDTSCSICLDTNTCHGDQKCCTDEGYPPQRACPEPRPCPPCRCECKCPEVPAVRWNEDCDKELERLREEATK